MNPTQTRRRCWALRPGPAPSGGILPALHRARTRLVGWSWLLLISASPAHATEPASEPAADSMAQRMRACEACHGKEGRAASDGYYPRIAGKPQEYLYRQLLNFRERRRAYAPMRHMVRHMTDEYLREIAGYFAALDVPYPAPQPGPTAATARARGAQLVKSGDLSRGLPACRSCHGQALTGVLPDVPGLVGLPRDYINAQLGAWRTGLRRAAPPDCMARVVARMEPQDIPAVSMWLASQPVPGDPKAVPPSPPPAPAHGTASVALGSGSGSGSDSTTPCGDLPEPTGGRR